MYELYIDVQDYMVRIIAKRMRDDGGIEELDLTGELSSEVLEEAEECIYGQGGSLSESGLYMPSMLLLRMVRECTGLDVYYPSPFSWFVPIPIEDRSCG